MALQLGTTVSTLVGELQSKLQHDFTSLSEEQFLQVVATLSQRKVHKFAMESGNLSVQSFGPEGKQNVLLLHQQDLWIPMSTTPTQSSEEIKLGGVLHKLLLERNVPVKVFLEALAKTTVQSLALETARKALRETKDLAWRAPDFSRLLWDLVGIASEVQDFSTLADSFQVLCDRKQAIERGIQERLASVNQALRDGGRNITVTREEYFVMAVLIASFNRGEAYPCLPSNMTKIFNSILSEYIGHTKGATQSSFPDLKHVDRWADYLPQHWYNASQRNRNWRKPSPLLAFDTVLQQTVTPMWGKSISNGIVKQLFGQPFVFLQFGPHDGTNAVCRKWCDPVERYGPLSDHTKFPKEGKVLCKTDSRTIIDLGGQCILKVFNLTKSAGDDIDNELFHHRRLSTLCGAFVPKLYAVTQHEGKLYYYMEKGRDLFHYATEGHQKFLQEFVPKLVEHKKSHPDFVSTNERLNEWEFEMRDYYFQLLHGMRELHDVYRVAHRDFKLENVILLEDESGKKRAALIDFGMMRGFPVTEPGFRSSRLRGTRAYMAPEVRFCGHHNQWSNCLQNIRTYDARAADVHTMGWVLFGMLTTKPLYAFDKTKPLQKDQAWRLATKCAYEREEPKLKNLGVQELLKHCGWEFFGTKNQTNCLDLLSPFAVETVQSCILPQEQRPTILQLLTSFIEESQRIRTHV